MKATKKITEKDTETLNKTYAKGKIYVAAIIKEQEQIINLAEKQKKAIGFKLEKLRKELVNNQERKTEYEELLLDRSFLEKAITVASSSITNAQLSLL